MTKTVITGADAGLGFSFVKQYAQAGHEVLAGCLSPHLGQIAELAQTVSNIAPLKLDVTSNSSIAAFMDQMKDEPVGLLINNAGVHYRKWSVPEDVVFSDWEHTLQVNTLGPARVSFAMRGNLARAGQSKLVTISSDWGSVTKHPGTAYDYCSSKAAVNSLMRGMAQNWVKDGITVLMVHPGWTRTSMGGEDAPATADENAEAVCAVIDNITQKDNGRFVDNQGNDMPW
ncbi:MAG: SDR family NAD(P)-dependent oxidoreductase [Roseitalea sp.]|jgi:NAD(P)-dependent dehydrogenase (short-subunit alcohol dehydrogenase family)|nr:SDR family NAD(P)-dependent oxidoreductase [Roseitalea sp.]MBO6745296.1 SDR family NAD(P)-dependent oxidoreductase [Roseitalea sp.]